MSNEVTIDLSNYKDRVGERIQPGKYRVVVDDVEQDTAKSGNTMINIWLRVLDGEFAGSTLIDRLVLHQNSLFRVVGFMQAIGMPTPKKKLRINVQSFLGKVLEVEVDDGDPYNGRVKSEIRGYYRVTSASDSGGDLSDLPGGDEDGEESQDWADTSVTAAASGVTSVLGVPLEDLGDAPDEVDLDTLSL